LTFERANTGFSIRSLLYAWVRARIFVDKITVLKKSALFSPRG